METLKFRIGLSGTYWDKKPQYSVWLNETSYAKGTVSGASNEIEYIEFDAELPDDAEQLLSIRLENKDNKDTILNGDRSEIVKDMLLNIESIEVDSIDVGTLRWSASEFVGDDPERPLLEGCVNLGWNGTYKFKFSTPFYLWLLEYM